MAGESTTFDQLDSLSDYYPMTKEILGQVYIFNHVSFDNRSLGTRYGSVKDCQDIEEVFHKLKFKVKIYKDLSYKKIVKTLSKIAEKDYSNFDCLVIFVLTHGGKRKIFAKDIDYYPDVYWNSFKDKPTFKNKPKLIFIQDSRGDEVDDETHYRIKMPQTVHHAPLVPTNYSLPDIPDVLLMYSCYDGFFSWRSCVTGSSFVQYLCYEIYQWSKSLDMLTLLTFLNPKLYVNFEENNSDDEKKHVIIISTLTKVLHFDR
ncbi:hypothetical protein RN001_014561 [Aquatica leii]|uniref:Uncharacterized protein n=1 Tax=Aquatica leii TaxID=1421715 RepID=A0AAN7NY03_9COLE|nr:hypothetical protein RN001_014561 [Aquatica leii]